MATIDFPDSPTTGQVFSAGGKSWSYSGTTWELLPSTASKSAYAIAVDNGFVGTEEEWLDSINGNYNASETAPLSPSIGDAWFNTTDGRTYIYYDNFWVEVGAAVTGATGPAGPQGETGPQGPQGTPGATGAAGADGGFDTAQTIQNVTSQITLDSTYAGKLVTNTGASSNFDVYLPGAGSGIPVGSQVDFLQTAASAQFIYYGEVGVTLLSKDSKIKTAGQYSPASIKRLADTTYVLVGDLGA